MGDEGAAEKLQWSGTSSHGFLVTKADTEQYHNKAVKEDRPTITPDEPSPPSPAILSAMVRLSRVDFFLAACSDWQVDNPNPILLSDVRRSAIAKEPGIPVYISPKEFQTTLSNIKELLLLFINSYKDGQFMETADWDEGGKGSRVGFKINHTFFKVHQLLAS